MLVVLHGLCGGSHEEYLRHVLAALTADGSWEACVLNARGCSQTKITTGVLYHAVATWDLRQTVEWLRETFPNRPLFGIGFSLGANILATVCLLSTMNQLRTYANYRPCKVLRTRKRGLSTEGGSILRKSMEYRNLFCQSTKVPNRS